MVKKWIFLTIILAVIFSLSACDLVPAKAPTEPETPSPTPDPLEEALPNISEYPSFKEVCKTLYGENGFSNSEIRYIEAIFNAFKTRTDLEQAPLEVLTALISNVIKLAEVHLIEEWVMDMDYFVDHVVPLAEEITVGCTNDTERANKISQWVKENVTVDPSSHLESLTIRAILEERTTPTDCGYYAATMIALFKAVGIPGRGYGHDINMVRSDWVFFYIKEWCAFDTTAYLTLSLEDVLPDISEYPSFKEVCETLHAAKGFSHSEVRYIEAIFNKFKTKKELQQASPEILSYLISNIIEPNEALGKVQAVDLDYFVDEVIPLAEEITKGCTSDKERVKKIAGWIRENIEVAGIPEGMEDRVEEILEKRKTNAPCDHYATLLTGLCRALGIPAREVGGYINLIGHAWNECYLGGEWIAVDSAHYLGRGLVSDADIAKFGEYLSSAYIYDPLRNCLRDVTLSYNPYPLRVVIEHCREMGIDSSTLDQAEELLRLWEQEGLGKRYLDAYEIMDNCIAQIIAEEVEVSPDKIVVTSLYDYGWYTLSAPRKWEENFANQVKNAEVICIYDVSATGKVIYRVTGPEEQFPLEKLAEVIQRNREYFPAKLYGLLVHYEKMDRAQEGKSAFVELLGPETMDAVPKINEALKSESWQVLEDLSDKIASVWIEKEESFFDLPKTLPDGISYKITTGETYYQQEVWKLSFVVKCKYRLGNIEITTVLWEPMLGGDRPLRGPTKVIDTKGKIYAEPPYKGCEDPAVPLAIDAGQRLWIKADDDYVVIMAEHVELTDG